VVEGRDGIECVPRFARRPSLLTLVFGYSGEVMVDIFSPTVQCVAPCNREQRVETMREMKLHINVYTFNLQSSER
jgi:hypothetical protein